MATHSKRNIRPFDGEKYSAWKFRIRSLLNELNVIHVIDATPAAIDDEWRNDNSIAVNTIVEYLDDSLLSFAEENQIAKQILEKMDEIYQRKSMATRIAIYKRLSQFKLNSEETLRSHFMKFDSIIKELIGAGAKVDEGEKITQLINSLPTSYEGVTTAIETLGENSLTLAFVKTRLLDHEVKLNQENNNTSAKALYIKPHANKNNNKNFKKPINKTMFKSNKNKRQIKCYHCGKLGHMKINCFLFKKQMNKNKENINSVQFTQQLQHQEPQQQQQQQQYKQPSNGFAFMIGMKNTKSNGFILDSGASDHIVNDVNIFENFVELEQPIKISIAKNNTFIKATKMGIVKLFTTDNVPLILQNVLYCKDVPHCLISVRRMQQAGITVEFTTTGVKLKKNGEVILLNNNNHGLPFLQLYVNVAMCNDQYDLWHRRLGHISNGKFLEILNKNLCEDIDRIKHIKPGNKICEPCLDGKQTRLAYNKSKDKSHVERPLFVIHTDVCGPIKPSTIDDKNYYVIFVDQFTHYCVTYLLKRKSDVFGAFKDFVAKAEAHFNLKVVNLYCDNGTEYLSHEMKDFCIIKGITFHLTVPYSPQLNGVSERMIRYLTETARAMLHDAKLDRVFWGEAVLTATYLINRRPSKALKVDKTPFELWHHKKPTIRYLKIFGSTVYVHHKTRLAKLDAKSWKGVLVGYEPNGYKLWNTEQGKFMTARDVVVDETSFLETRPVEKSEKFDENGFKQTDTESIELENSDENSFKSVSRTDMSGIKPDNSISGMECDSVSETEGCKNSSRDSECEIELRRSCRIKKMSPVSYSDMVNECAMNAQCSADALPNSYNEIALRSDSDLWKEAIKEELQSHFDNETWTLVSKPIGKNIVDCKWVFVIKYDELGNPKRYKARLVARGFTQEYLTDFEETFAPVARISSFRFLIAFATQFNLFIHQMDVKTAFLNGVLAEEIYMKIPQGLTNDNNKVCKLNKAIYGLKQAARCWFEAFETVLLKQGFKSSEADRCIYILDKGSINKNIYVLLYVDDILIATENIATMTSFKLFLSQQFKMTDIGQIKHFIGIRIEKENNKIILSQSSYIQNVLKKFNMQDCKPVSTPLPSKLNYDALNTEDDTDAPCRQLIGSLMYIMLCTRPDLSTAVNIMSRYSNKSSNELWQNLKRILRYLKGTINLKLEFKRNTYENILEGFVDSDWGGGADRRSTTGYLFKLFETNTICWNTRKQPSVAASSTEAEYMALFEAVRESLWLKSLCESFKMPLLKEIVIYEDNQGCICIANNPSSHKRSKHIDIKFHFSREQVEKKIIKLIYIPTEHQLADILTKPMSAARFEMLRSKIGLK